VVEYDDERGQAADRVEFFDAFHRCASIQQRG
jgi:hypothetical protein